MHFALRTFRRSPGFACAVALVAGLGIAINSAVFTALNAMFIRPLPVPRPHEIVRVYTNESRHHELYGASSYPDYLDVRQVPGLRGLAAYIPLAATVRIDGRLVRGEGRLVSENFFEVLDIGATVGRMLSEGDRRASDAVPIVLGHAFWRRHFAADRTAVGRFTDINGASAVVIGVVAAVFVGIEPSQVDVYFPVSRHGTLAPGFGFVDDRGARLVNLIGRLAAEVTDARGRDAVPSGQP